MNGAKKNRRTSRRRFLRCAAGGMGTMLALPALESWPSGGSRAKAQEDGRPLRMCFITTGNGMNMSAWMPTDTGDGFALSPTLAPLEPYRDQLTVVSGLDNAIRGHGAANAAYLTGVAPFQTKDPAELRCSISIDQVLASELGADTPVPSVHCGIHAHHTTSAQYHAFYQERNSWLSATDPVLNTFNPLELFDSLFSGFDPGMADLDVQRRQFFRRSVVDFVLEDATQLQPRLSLSDQRRLDAYLTSVREVERRLTTVPTRSCTVPDAPAADIADVIERTHSMMDVLALAFTCDVTRVATFMITPASSNMAYRNLPHYDWVWPEGTHRYHHGLSHYQDNPDMKLAALAEVDRFHIELVASFAERLQAADDGGGQSVLDNAVIQYGSPISDGKNGTHSPENVPLVLVGKGGGLLAGNRHAAFGGRPLSNLYLNYLSAAGSAQTSFGADDGSGPLTGLA